MNEQIEYYKQALAFQTDSSDLFEALNNNENIVPVDTRKAEGFRREHIPGALNLPHREMNEDTTKNLDKNTLYVCYCDGIGCNASTKGSLKLAALGFKVKELIGGIAWWRADGYATEGEQASAGTIIECAC